jgi:DNA invertase Pin-like site-specific DNA recombinase
MTERRGTTHRGSTIDRKQAVIYARVSSKEQEREGFSIPAQLRQLREYGREHGLTVIEEFVDVETAKQSGRTGFRWCATSNVARRPVG